MKSHPTSGTAPAVNRAGIAGFRLGYRPALDGVRGIAILGVVGVHAEVMQNRAAFIGVDAFFVLSGLLITSLLVEEWDRFQGIRLGQFYARRGLRLLPALVLMLGTLVLYRSLFGEPGAGTSAAWDGLIALFYSSNWGLALGYRRPEMFGHTWSLSIEEQFYLVWPVTLLWLLRRKTGRASLAWWVLLGVFLVVVYRCLLVAGGGSWYHLTFGTDSRADALLLGCAIGLMFSAGLLPGTARVRRVVKGLAWVGVAGLAWLTFYAGFGYAGDFCVAYTLIPLFAAFVLVEAVLAETGVLARVLAQPWLVYLGKISYGLYLWHYPIFGEVQAWRLPWAWELILEGGLTALAVLGSYYLLERPLLRLKARFTPRLTRNSVPLEQTTRMD